MNSLKLAFLSVACSALVSCATLHEREDGRDPDDPPITGMPDASKFTLCKTTYADLVGLMGNPSRDGRIHRARVATWVYELEPMERYIGVLFDENNIAVDVYWNMPTEVIWSPTNQCK